MPLEKILVVFLLFLSLDFYYYSICYKNSTRELQTQHICVCVYMYCTWKVLSSLFRGWFFHKMPRENARFPLPHRKCGLVVIVSIGRMSAFGAKTKEKQTHKQLWTKYIGESGVWEPFGCFRSIWFWFWMRWHPMVYAGASGSYMVTSMRNRDYGDILFKVFSLFFLQILIDVRFVWRVEFWLVLRWDGMGYGMGWNVFVFYISIAYQ